MSNGLLTVSVSYQRPILDRIRSWFLWGLYNLFRRFSGAIETWSYTILQQESKLLSLVLKYERMDTDTFFLPTNLIATTGSISYPMRKGRTVSSVTCSSTSSPDMKKLELERIAETLKYHEGR